MQWIHWFDWSFDEQFYKIMGMLMGLHHWHHFSIKICWTFLMRCFFFRSHSNYVYLHFRALSGFCGEASVMDPTEINEIEVIVRLREKWMRIWNVFKMVWHSMWIKVWSKGPSCLVKRSYLMELSWMVDEYQTWIHLFVVWQIVKILHLLCFIRNVKHICRFPSHNPKNRKQNTYLTIRQPTDISLGFTTW